MTTRARVVEVETPTGPARAHLKLVSRPRAAVVLGHGAGGGIAAPDLAAAAAAAERADASVALIEQPYRVAGRRAPVPAAQLDAAWAAVVEELAGGPLAGMPLVTGGRSSGARVACRTAAATAAVGVLCLAFPLRPPRRARPAPSRLPELAAVRVPVLVVQGRSDPFGMPRSAKGRRVVRVSGTHSLAAAWAEVEAAVASWLAQLLDERLQLSA